MPQSPPVQFRSIEVEAALDARIGRRHTRGTRAAEDLARYYALVARELDTVRLSAAEWATVLRVTNGTAWESSSIPLVWAEVADADPSSVEPGCDRDALVTALRGLTAGQRFALVDAAERFWRRPDDDDGCPFVETLADLGVAVRADA